MQGESSDKVENQSRKNTSHLLWRERARDRDKDREKEKRRDRGSDRDRYRDIERQTETETCRDIEGGDRDRGQLGKKVIGE